MTRRLAGLTLAALAVTACATRAIVEPHELAGWHAVAAEDAVLIAEASARETESLAANLAGFDAAFAHLIGRKIASQKPTIFHFIRNPRLHTPLYLGPGVAGWAGGTLEESLACVQLRSKVETRMTLFHEYTHLLLARQRASNIPRWYNEGLAEYFGTLSVRDGAVVVGSVPYQNLQRLTAEGPLPLPELFGPLEHVSIYDFYATSWVFVHYLLSTPRGREELSRFEKELAAGVALDTARERAFGRSFDALTAELKTHIGYLARGVSGGVVLDPRRIQVAQPSAARTLAAHETARALARVALSLEEGSYEERGDRIFRVAARDLLDIAVAAEDSNARARAALAYVHAISGDAEDARSEIARALADAPGGPEVLWRAGEVALALGDTGVAEQRFREAIAVDERFASAWFGLGRALDQRGDAAGAIGALERARAIAWSDALDLELGRVYLGADRTGDARRLLQPLAADPHGGERAKRAAELLRAAGLAQAVDSLTP